MKLLCYFIFFILFEFIFFGLTAFYYGKKCHYDCRFCKNWACTNGTKYSSMGCFPVINWYRWCNNEKR